VPVLCGLTPSLPQAIECLCVFVEASGPHGLDSPTMAEELLALAWPLRGSTFPEVRHVSDLPVDSLVACTRIRPTARRADAAMPQPIAYIDSVP
jgi:hypothetical protein